MIEKVTSLLMLQQLYLAQSPFFPLHLMGVLVFVVPIEFSPTLPKHFFI